MKQNFEEIPGCHVVPGHLVHCTRCGLEYPSTSLVHGRRIGEEYWHWRCMQDICFGKSPQDIVKVTVESA